MSLARSATRTGGIDLNKPRIRAALPAALALAPAPGGFTVAQFTAKVGAMTLDDRYTTRQAEPVGKSPASSRCARN